MARNENPPFGRGEHISVEAGCFDHLVGKKWLFEDLDYSVSGPKPYRTNRDVLCRLVKNGAGINLLPSRAVSYKLTTGDYGAIVNGYTTTGAQHGVIVDEWLPAAGVPDAAYFWVVEAGPTLALTPLAGAEFNGDIAAGAILVSLTAATSGATTAGRLAVQNITGSSQATDYTFLANQFQNWFGRALSAKTTGNTNATVLIEMGRAW